MATLHFDLITGRFVTVRPIRRRNKDLSRFVSTDGGRAACGFGGEDMDCAPRAAAIALGITYEDAHARYKAQGRVDGRRTPPHMTEAVLGVPVVYDFRERKSTVAQWLKDHPRGRFVVWVHGHVFAVLDGIVHDNGAGLYKPRQRVIGHYEVKA